MKCVLIDEELSGNRNVFLTDGYHFVSYKLLTEIPSSTCCSPHKCPFLFQQSVFYCFFPFQPSEPLLTSSKVIIFIFPFFLFDEIFISTKQFFFTVPPKSAVLWLSSIIHHVLFFTFPCFSLLHFQIMGTRNDVNIQ